MAQIIRRVTITEVPGKGFKDRKGWKETDIDSGKSRFHTTTWKAEQTIRREDSEILRWLGVSRFTQIEWRPATEWGTAFVSRMATPDATATA